jgi:hypothetical protein
MAFTDYTSGGGGSPGGGQAASAPEPSAYPSLGKLKAQYLDYLSTKRAEINEQQDARRYRHGAQYTAEQIAALNKRRQPVVTYNRISRKINGVVGLVEKMKMDPKAYPRTPKHEQGAELATAVLRYVMDSQDWDAKAPIVAARGAEEGIGGLELTLEKGDKGDVEISFDVIENEGFFYDPRSMRHDFSDARFMGVGKWMDVDQAKDMFPDKADQLDSALDGADLSQNSDREQKWYSSDGKSVRVVDHWYRHKGEWCWTIYTGSLKLMEGKSFLKDEKGQSICKYICFSANVDHDGDRYGFVRELKSAQDEINARRSKGLHELNTRRIIAEAGAFDDIEVARREAARPDGVVIRNPGLSAEFDDAAKAANLAGQLQFLQEAKNEIENFGPNPALLGQGVENSSGRAIALLQQAGIAELGPYILAYRGWKIRVYRALMSAIQQHWTAERWIRVTDDDDVAQFIQINGVGIDPNTGMPTMVNAIGSMDVDIIMDEGADSINVMADAYDTLTVLASRGQNIPGEVLIELSPLQSSVKKRVLEIMKQAQQPGPAQQLELAGGQAKVAETQASAELKQAQTVKTLMEAHAPPEMPNAGQQAYEPPAELQNMKMAAETEATFAKARASDAKAIKDQQDAMLAPQKMRLDAFDRAADREMAAQRPPK